MIDLNLEVHSGRNEINLYDDIKQSLKVRLGDKAPSHDQLLSLGFHKCGFIKKIITFSFSSGETLYRTSSCQISMLDGSYHLMSIPLGVSRCNMVIEIYLKNGIIFKELITLHTWATLSDELPSSAEVFFTEFFEKCKSILGESTASIDDWGYLWADSESSLKAGLINRRQFFIQWELTQMK